MLKRTYRMINFVGQVLNLQAGDMAEIVLPSQEFSRGIGSLLFSLARAVSDEAYRYGETDEVIIHSSKVNAWRFFDSLSSALHRQIKREWVSQGWDYLSEKGSNSTLHRNLPSRGRR